MLTGQVDMVFTDEDKRMSKLLGEKVQAHTLAEVAVLQSCNLNGLLAVQVM